MNEKELIKMLRKIEKRKDLIKDINELIKEEKEELEEEKLKEKKEELEKIEKECIEEIYNRIENLEQEERKAWNHLILFNLFEIVLLLYKK